MSKDWHMVPCSAMASFMASIVASERAPLCSDAKYKDMSVMLPPPAAVSAGAMTTVAEKSGKGTRPLSMRFAASSWICKIGIKVKGERKR